MIDAHVHLWQPGRNGCQWPGPDLPTLHRDFGMGDLRAAAGAVEQVVLVQSQPDEADTRWLIDQAAQDPAIAGVVGWVDLRAADVTVRIDALRGGGKLVGIRPMVQDLADDWYDDPALDAGLAGLAARGLVLEALVRPRHLPALARLAARHPTLAIVIDHGAKPAAGGDRGAWEAMLRMLARHPQIACKLSGLVTEITDDRPIEATIPLIRKLVAMFGAERLLWGSDWPVVTLRASYREWHALVRRVIAVRHHAAMFGGNAARIYRLAPRSVEAGA